MARTYALGAAPSERVCCALVYGGHPDGRLTQPRRHASGAAGTVKLPPGLVQARLTDAGQFGRVAPGASGGRLDLLSYHKGHTFEEPVPGDPFAGYGVP